MRALTGHGASLGSMLATDRASNLVADRTPVTGLPMFRENTR